MTAEDVGQLLIVSALSVAIGVLVTASMSSRTRETLSVFADCAADGRVEMASCLSLVARRE